MAKPDKPAVQRDPRGEWVKNQTGLEFFVVKSNENFEKFYAAQKTCFSEEEWQECLAAMKRELPQGFRVDESSQYCQFVKKTLQAYSSKHQVLKGTISRLYFWTPGSEPTLRQCHETSRIFMGQRQTRPAISRPRLRLRLSGPLVRDRD